MFKALESWQLILREETDELGIPEEWTEVFEKLNQDLLRKGLGSYRPVSCFPAVRKLWAVRLVELHVKTFQTAFVRSVDAV